MLRAFSSPIQAGFSVLRADRGQRPAEQPPAFIHDQAMDHLASPPTTGAA